MISSASAPGLICLAGGARSPLSRALIRGDDPRALADRLRRNLRRGQSSISISSVISTPTRSASIRKLAALAEASGDSRSSRPTTYAIADADRTLLDVLTCIRLKTTLEEAGRALWVNAERHLKSPAEMAALFRDLPDALAATRRDRRSMRLHARATSATDFPTIRCRPARRPTATCALLTYAGARERWGAALDDRTRRQLEHELDDHREAQARRLLPHRLGHRAVLPRERDHGAGARLGGQQRGLLRARNHGGRRGQDGTAVRALSLRGARRMARHRSRPAERRPAREGHPVRLSALRRARRRDDRQRDHLSHAAAPCARSARCWASPPNRSTGSHGSTTPTNFATTMTKSAALLKRGGVDVANAAHRDDDRRWCAQIQDLPRHLGQHSGGMVIARGAAR